MPPPLEVCDLEGTAVLWPFLGYSANGEVVVEEPVEVEVRWQWKRSAMVNSEGVTVAVDAKVVVDRDVDENSLMWEGELADLSGTGSTQPTPGEIMRVAVTLEGRDFKYDPRNTRRELGLVFYKGRLSVVLND